MTLGSSDMRGILPGGSAMRTRICDQRLYRRAPMPLGQANTPYPYARSEVLPARSACGICQKQQRIECCRIPYGPPQPVRQSIAVDP
ncbi:hypothetical protein GCM10010298_34040 [Streptomyces microflavus]|uniref:Uncharacterized protein n=1 Tax=Streptomyces microflavus TaxID=1919 RepID=A0A7J0D6I0_STRMI|nr:hypothetical protein Smic_82010 [Streptomyces microflavus]GGX66565.1 hypothetical protein GCM10010298_34040 [Streptomyces microflavus]